MQAGKLVQANKSNFSVKKTFIGCLTFDIEMIKMKLKVSFVTLTKFTNIEKIFCNGRNVSKFGKGKMHYGIM